MEYKRLGTSNLRVSPLCLGTMMFGDQTELTEARNIVASARDQGINFIDTADVYTNGASEEMVGKIIGPNRYDWILASKVGNAMSSAPNQSRYSRHWITRSVEESLRRLDTDHLDILYLHRDFHLENLDEAVRSVGDLIRSGKIRAFALSNFRGWRIAEIMRLCEQANVPQPIACQPYYNMLTRVAEVEILPACEHYGLGVVPYSPIARGVLTGKYTPGETPPESSRAGRQDPRMMQTEFREESLLIAQKLKVHIQNHDITLGQFATAWVLANQIVSSVIVGPRTLEQMTDYYPALDIRITEQDEALIDSLIAPGHSSTPGYNDPGHPFFGRKTSGVS